MEEKIKNDLENIPDENTEVSDGEVIDDSELENVSGGMRLPVGNQIIEAFSLYAEGHISFILFEISEVTQYEYY